MNIETLLEWSEPKSVTTKRGPRLLRTACPTGQFWGEWRSNSPALKENGVQVGKNRDTGEWEVCWWQATEETPTQPEPTQETGTTKSEPEKGIFGRPAVTVAPAKVTKTERVWSEEQVKIGNWFKSGKGNLQVRARAGTGKTTTIEWALRQAPEEKMLYAVFNKKNQREAEEKITDVRVEIKTLHALGFKYIKGIWKDAKADTGNTIEYDRIARCYKDIPDEVATAVERLVGFAKNTCAHMPSISDLIVIADERFIECGSYEQEENGGWNVAKLAGVALQALQAATVKELDGRISFNDMVWLPVVMNWVRAWFPLVVIDESQDMSLPQLIMAMRACVANGRICVVGDDRQCVVKGTKISTVDGETNVEELRKGIWVKTCSGRGKTTMSCITDFMQRDVVKCPVVTVTTKGGKRVTVTAEHLFFGKFDANSSNDPIHFVYLMFREDLGFRIGTTKRHSEQIKRNGESQMGFQVRMNQERADKLWLLGSYSTEQEARYFEQFYSVGYGIPTWIWNTGGRDVFYNEEYIKKLYASIDTVKNGNVLLNSLGLFYDKPHYVPKCSKRDRRNFSITLCADSRGKSAMHHYSISGDDVGDLAKLDAAGISTRGSGIGKDGWRVEGITTNLGKIYSLLNQVKDVMPVNIIEKARLTDRAMHFIPASHLLRGMSIFVSDGKAVTEDIVETVIKEEYTGIVYDLNVAATHNYISNGVVSHNCIYGFRGAVTSGLDMMKSKLSAVEMGLTTTYRCPKKVVALAQIMVPDYKVADSAPEGIVDEANESAMLESVQVGDAVLSRTNAPLMPLCLQLLRKGVAARIEGRDLGKALVGLVRKMKGRSVPDFIGKVERWGDKMKNRARKSKNAEEKISGIEDQVLTLVAVAEGAASVFEIEKRILDIFQDSDKCPKPAVIFSSVHKAKGLEFFRVFILEYSFSKKISKHVSESKEEQNIRYVAITRAKHHLIRVHKSNVSQSFNQNTATGTQK